MLPDDFTQFRADGDKLSRKRTEQSLFLEYMSDRYHSDGTYPIILLHIVALTGMKYGGTGIWKGDG